MPQPEHAAAADRDVEVTPLETTEADLNRLRAEVGNGMMTLGCHRAQRGGGKEIMIHPWFRFLPPLNLLRIVRVLRLYIVLSEVIFLTVSF